MCRVSFLPDPATAFGTDAVRRVNEFFHFFKKSTNMKKIVTGMRRHSVTAFYAVYDECRSPGNFIIAYTPEEAYSIALGLDLETFEIVSYHREHDGEEIILDYFIGSLFGDWPYDALYDETTNCLKNEVKTSVISDISKMGMKKNP